MAQNIERLAAARGVRKAAVQRGAGLARATFYDKLGNRPGHFTVEEAANIADVLGVELSDLMRPTPGD